MSAITTLTHEYRLHAQVAEFEREPGGRERNVNWQRINKLDVIKMKDKKKCIYVYRLMVCNDTWKCKGKSDYWY